MIRRAMVSAIVLGLALPWLPAQGATPKTRHVSVRSNGDAGDFGSRSPSTSANGRFVAFKYEGDDLVGGDDNVAEDIFVHDRKTKKTKRVSVRSNGNQADASSSDPLISANGRFVAFDSSATNLVGGDTNSRDDIFVHDRRTKKTKRVNVRSNGEQGNGHSFDPSISANGRFVAFESEATNLVPGDDNASKDIFVHDRKTKKTTRVSVRSNGDEADGLSETAAISADGRFVVFGSGATNLVGGDDNGYYDIFVHDRKTKKTKRVSVRSNGTEANFVSFEPSISADGRFVAFGSAATNLVGGDNNGYLDVFVHDRKTKKTTRVSVRSNGAQGNDHSRRPSISASGRFVAFDSSASNLVPGDNNASEDVFLHDRKTKKTKRVSVRSNGDEADGGSGAASISADGRFVAFGSVATNLFSGDDNDEVDIFLRGPLR